MANSSGNRRGKTNANRTEKIMLIKQVKKNTPARPRGKDLLRGFSIVKFYYHREPKTNVFETLKSWPEKVFDGLKWEISIGILKSLYYP